MPAKVEEVYQLVKCGEIEKAKKLQYELDEINDAMFLETNPIPVKTFMHHMGLISDEVRMPLVKPNDRTLLLIVRLTDRLKENRSIII